jgi:hypothetical protein
VIPADVIQSVRNACTASPVLVFFSNHLAPALIDLSLKERLARVPLIGTRAEGADAERVWSFQGWLLDTALHAWLRAAGFDQEALRLADVRHSLGELAPHNAQEWAKGFERVRAEVVRKNNESGSYIIDDEIHAQLSRAASGFLAPVTHIPVARLLHHNDQAAALLRPTVAQAQVLMNGLACRQLLEAATAAGEIDDVDKFIAGAAHPTVARIQTDLVHHFCELVALHGANA